MSESDENSSTPHESKLTLPWCVVILLLVTFNGWMLVSLMNQGDRVTKIETRLDIHLPMMAKTLSDVQNILKDVRDDQIRRQEKEPK